jgi:hypothetical protein
MGLDPVWLRDGRVLFTDTTVATRAAAAVSMLNPQNGTKQIVVDVQGYIVGIDVRPGKTQNFVNPKSRGNIEVAVLSTKTFDAPKLVNQSTLRFGRTGNENSLTRCRKKLKDVNNDGLPDLVCRFSLAAADFKMGNTTATLRFQDLTDTPYEGRDSISTVTEDDADDFKDAD